MPSFVGTVTATCVSGNMVQTSVPPGDAGGACELTAAAAAKSFQSCPTLCNPIDGSPPGSPVPGILQARTLEWVAIAFPTHEREK